MTAPTHINRHVHSFGRHNSSQSDEEIRLLLVEEALMQGTRQAIVMPSQGTILFISSNGNHEQWTCSKDKVSWPEEMKTTLQSRDLFTEDAPPAGVPSKLVTPVAGEDPHYLVQKTVYPQATHYHLMD